MDASANRRRISLRLRDYNYSQPGAYFITLCIQDRKCLLGNIVGNAMHLNESGHVISEAWQWLPQQYPYVSLDSFVVMPNHVHGVLVIGNPEGGSRTAPTKVKPLGGLIAAFKTISAKSVNAQRGMPGAELWQRNYYEHVIRNETDLQRIREYIQNNPAQWALDEENPDRSS